MDREAQLRSERITALEEARHDLMTSNIWFVVAIATGITELAIFPVNLWFIAVPGFCAIKGLEELRNSKRAENLAVLIAKEMRSFDQGGEFQGEVGESR